MHSEYSNGVTRYRIVGALRKPGQTNLEWGGGEIRKYFFMEGGHLSAESRMTMLYIRQIRCGKGVLD